MKNMARKGTKAHTKPNTLNPKSNTLLQVTGKSPRGLIPKGLGFKVKRPLKQIYNQY